MKIIKISYLLSSLVLLSLTQMSCSEEKEEAIKVTGIAISQKSVTLKKGGAFKVRAVIKPYDATFTDNILWTTSNAQIATVNSDGLITGKASGKTKIRAILEGTDPELFGESTVSVSSESEGTPDIVLKPSLLSLITGGNFTPEVILSKERLKEAIVWTSENDNIATVDQSGKITAIKPGTVKIIATLRDVETNASCIVNISDKVPDVKTISISPTNLTLKKNEVSQPLTIVITPPEANQRYSLTLSEGGNQFVRLDKDRRTVTALNSGQTINVIATSLQDPTKVAVCEVQLTLPIVRVASLRVTNKNISVNEGEKNPAGISLDIQPSDASDKSYSLRILTGSKFVSLISNNRDFRGDSPGRATIKVYSNADPNLSDTITINVIAVQRPVTSIIFSGNITTLSLTVNESRDLTAIVQPSNASDDSLRWSIDTNRGNSSAVIITPKSGQKKCTITGKTVGTAYVRATSVSTPTISEVCIVTVVTR